MNAAFNVHVYFMHGNYEMRLCRLQSAGKCSLWWFGVN
jgi:hypothetical protein